VDVLLDGEPIQPSKAGADVRAGRVILREERLYRLLSLDRVEDLRLTLADDIWPASQWYARPRWATFA
jgi:hypothetical protein